MRVARKLIIVVVLALAAVLAVHGYTRIQRESALLDREARRDHQLLGRSLALGMAHVWRESGQAAALALVDEMNEKEPEIEIRFVWAGAPSNPSNRPQAPVDVLAPLRNGREAVWVGSRNGGGESLYTYIPVHIAGVAIGAIELSESRAADYQFVRTSVRSTVVTTLIAALASGIAILVLGIAVVGRPVRSLVAQARRIGSGDLSSRLRPMGGDEIGDLAREMNAMTDQLANARALIQAETHARLEAQKRLEHADRLTTVGKLAAGIAHELGTPLNVISQRAQMISSRELTGDAAVDRARTIEEQADRMAAIIRQLLDFARTSEPRKSEQDLASVVKAATALLHPLARKRKIEVAIAEPESPIRVPVDPGQIQQVLANLLVNAFDAMPDGGKVEIAVQAVETRPPTDVKGSMGRYATVTVQDHGEGIPRETVGRLFEPFFTTKPPGEGTGLGLSVAYGLIREHGGWISVESEQGVGSRFTVHLPMGEAG